MAFTLAQSMTELACRPFFNCFLWAGTVSKAQTYPTPSYCFRNSKIFKEVENLDAVPKQTLNLSLLVVRDVPPFWEVLSCCGDKGLSKTDCKVSPFSVRGLFQTLGIAGKERRGLGWFAASAASKDGICKRNSWVSTWSEPLSTSAPSMNLVFNVCTLSKMFSVVVASAPSWLSQIWFMVACCGYLVLGKASQLVFQVKWLPHLCSQSLFLVFSVQSHLFSLIFLLVISQFPDQNPARPGQNCASLKC